MKRPAAGGLAIDVHDHAAFAAEDSRRSLGDPSLYEGIFDVTLDGCGPITFVPRFARELGAGAWPITERPRDGLELPRDRDEARLWHAQAARYVVTPDAGEPRFASYRWAYRTAHEPAAMAYAFFVRDAMFSLFSRELAAPRSQLARAAVVEYLRTTVMATILAEGAPSSRRAGAPQAVASSR